MDFVVEPLNPESFRPFFDLDDASLESSSIRRFTVDDKPGYPCRVSLRDAEIGEEVFLFPYEHLKVNSPFRSSGAVFVRRDAVVPSLGVNELPEMLKSRTLSVRGYDNEGMMAAAMITPGLELEQGIARVMAEPGVDYLHVHNAERGCFLCCIRRVDD